MSVYSEISVENVDNISHVRNSLQPQFDFIQSLDKEVKESLYNYTTEYGYHAELNEMLQKSIEITKPFYKKMYTDMVYCFDNSPHLLNAITVYKGSEDPEKFTNIGFNLNYFLSTSMDSREAMKFIEDETQFLFVITCTPGSYSVLPLENISESPSELEVLLPPKGKFSIQKLVEKNDSLFNVNTIYATYIPENSVFIQNLIPDKSFWKKLTELFY